MRINLRVTYTDGTAAADTAAVTADLVAFEEHFNRSVARLEVELRLTDICWLAWHSLHRKGSTGLEFHPWLETVDGVELTEGTAPVPLETSPSTGD